MKKWFSFLVSIWLLLTAGCGTIGDDSFSQSLDSDSGQSTDSSSEVIENLKTAKNVILMIGDGMGPEHVRAGELTKKAKLAMQEFPYQVKVSTMAANSAITDSAAAATALATGKRTNTALVGKDPAGSDLPTIVDWAKAFEKRTGIITTEELYGATPMGFSGHSSSRLNYNELIETAAESSNVDLFVSYTMDTSYGDMLRSGGYTEIESPENISEAEQDKIFGFYNIKADAPAMTNDWKVSLDYIVTEALEYLSADEDGFFLMTEGAHIDHGAHNNNFNYMIKELLAFDDAVKVVLEWAKNRDDTVVLVTADHETGGFHINEPEDNDSLTDEERYERPLSYYFTGDYHTATMVNCYIYGADIDFASYSIGAEDRIANIDVFQIMKGLFMGTCAVKSINRID